MENLSLTAPPPILRHNPSPGSILIDPYGYISHRTNATTADGVTRDGKRIMVTFWAAKPPHGSYFTFCLRSPDLGISDFTDKPHIMCTEGDLVLLRFPICNGGSGLPGSNHYFVYRAGTGTAAEEEEDTPPSLELIPSPPISRFADGEAGLLPCRTTTRDDTCYFVAILRPDLSGLPRRQGYFLHLYNSKTKAWTTKRMQLHQERAYRNSTKVIAIGGDQRGSLGWVDLWQGILICDVLVDNHVLRYIPLPPAPASTPTVGPPRHLRDIIVFDGRIKLVNIGGYSGTWGWQAATHIWSDSNENWEPDCEIKVDEKDSALPVMKGSYLGYPALSLHDGDVVCIMTDRQGLLDKKALVIAVDLRKHIVIGAAIFRPCFTVPPTLGVGYPNIFPPRNEVVNYTMYIGTPVRVGILAASLASAFPASVWRIQI